MYEIVFSELALKDIQVLDKITKKRVLVKLQYFVEHDRPLDFAKHLTNYVQGEYRWRVGNFRIIFDLEDETIVVLRIQHRSEVYK
jgi:mRNA interferase RelE/StbE